MCFLVVAQGINLVFLSTLWGLLQNFNLLYLSVEIKAFYLRHAFRKKAWAMKLLRLTRGDLSHSTCLRQAGSVASENSVNNR